VWITPYRHLSPGSSLGRPENRLRPGRPKRREEELGRLLRTLYPALPCAISWSELRTSCSRAAWYSWVTAGACIATNASQIADHARRLVPALDAGGYHVVPRVGPKARPRLTDGLAGVEAACAEALADDVHSADVILSILARHRDPAPAATILTPDAQRLRHRADVNAQALRYASGRSLSLHHLTVAIIGDHDSAFSAHFDSLMCVNRRQTLTPVDIALNI
jgi:hypothetical protein